MTRAKDVAIGAREDDEGGRYVCNAPNPDGDEFCGLDRGHDGQHVSDDGNLGWPSALFLAQAALDQARAENETVRAEYQRYALRSDEALRELNQARADLAERDAEVARLRAIRPTSLVELLDQRDEARAVIEAVRALRGVEFYDIHGIRHDALIRQSDLRAALNSKGDDGVGCSTPGCDGDVNYAAPGRGHIASCHWPVGDEGVGTE